MPLLLLGGAALVGALFTGFGVGVDNITQKATHPSGATQSATLPDIIKWPLIIAATVVAIKYGSKLVKRA